MNLLKVLGFKVDDRPLTGAQIRQALEYEIKEYEFANNRLPSMIVLHPDEWLRFLESEEFERKINGVLIHGTSATGVKRGTFQYWYGDPSYCYKLKV